MPRDIPPTSPQAAVRRQWVLVIAHAALVLVVLVGSLSSVPAAGMMLAGMLGALAVARLVLPVAGVGALAVRSRGADVAVLVLLAIGLGVLSSSPNL